MFKRKHSGNLSVLVFLLMILAVTHLHAADYFVNKRGADRYNGRSRETAFLTIRKGIDTLKPGDTLTIGPGEYFENVKRENLGSLDAETVIRAEIPGTTLLRGDVPSPEFKKVDGYHFIYAARFGRKPNAIFEHNTMHTLLAKANVAELEFDPGFFYYDGDSKTLYISNRNLTPPDQCRYTISVNENNGLDLSHPRRVVIEGLAVTGFHPGWGICLSAPVSCVVRDCVCFMNSGGITLQPTEHSAGDDCGSDNLIENCVCYGNNFGGIVRYVAQNDVIHNCYTYKNIREDDEHFGIMHYHSMKGPLLIKDNISWGQNFDFSVKPGGRQETLENCVGLGYVRISPNKMVHNLLGGGNEYDRGSTNAPADTVLFLREKDVDKDFEFADSLNLDFRLQPDSRFRGTAPDGHDRGAYPYKANIFYVSPTGDDGADGLSMRKSWRTLERALEGRRPGDTVYLAEGKYAAAPLNETRDGKSPIRICGRGRGTVVIAGKQFLTGGAGIVLERLNFADGVVLENCRDVTFKNCTFFGRADGLCGNDVKNLKVTHCVFAGVPLNLTRSDGVMLSGNLYANPGRPAIRLDAESSIRYSDYNNYQNGAQRWEVNGATWSFAELKRRQHDLYSQKITPKFIVAKGAPRLSNEVLFKSVGPSSTALGIHHEYDAAPETLGLVGPFLHSTSNTT
ncbi:MAG: right-handed parallel beta-helix repeat-containing protein, partial [Sedimentisphaerales bacterium]|nr:right-handed parallel beta-helix repeat-containing protein [Sedimentisphaerales bacterium]